MERKLKVLLASVIAYQAVVRGFCTRTEVLNLERLRASGYVKKIVIMDYISYVATEKGEAYDLSDVDDSEILLSYSC